MWIIIKSEFWVKKGAIILFIRISKEEDKEQINEILMLCFGDRSQFGCLENLNGRYLLAYDNNKLIGITGLYYNQELKRYEIDWTGTHPEYRHKGIAYRLINEASQGIVGFGVH